MNKWVSEWLYSLKWPGLKEIKNLYLPPEGKDEAALGFCWEMERQHSQHARHSRETREQVYEEVALMIGEGNGTPLQYSGLENPMDGGAW